MRSKKSAQQILGTDDLHRASVRSHAEGQQEPDTETQWHFEVGAMQGLLVLVCFVQHGQDLFSCVPKGLEK
jgi:hypothetical protein